MDQDGEPKIRDQTQKKLVKVKLNRKMSCLFFCNSKRKVSEPASKNGSGQRSWSPKPIEGSGRTDSNRTSPRLSEETSTSSGTYQLELASMPSQKLQVFTYNELKVATKNFFQGDMLGEGGFGCVYKGYVRHKGEGGDMKMAVAVKQLNQKSMQGHKQWLNEVNFLGLANHPNLVKLVGYCAEDNEKGIQRLLVYEFVPNKSLAEHLFVKSKSTLSWHSRVQIALGAARGLAYLHEEMAFPVIFRDFKASNILLDNDFEPKLSDFGLAREGPGLDNSHVTTAVVGTIGYAAPEYIQTGHLTAKSDVWSFGVVLLELLTGRKSLDRNRPKNELKLLHWVKPYMSDSKKFPEMIDPKLEGKYSLKAAYRVASVASRCLQRYPKARPKMSSVVEALQLALEISESTNSSNSVALPQNTTGENKSNTSPKCSPNTSSPGYNLKGALKFASTENRHVLWRKLTLKRRLYVMECWSITTCMKIPLQSWITLVFLRLTVSSER